MARLPAHRVGRDPLIASIPAQPSPALPNTEDVDRGQRGDSVTTAVDGRTCGLRLAVPAGGRLAWPGPRWTACRCWRRAWRCGCNGPPMPICWRSACGFGSICREGCRPMPNMALAWPCPRPGAGAGPDGPAADRYRRRHLGLVARLACRVSGLHACLLTAAQDFCRLQVQRVERGSAGLARRLKFRFRL